MGVSQNLASFNNVKLVLCKIGSLHRLRDDLSINILLELLYNLGRHLHILLVNVVAFFRTSNVQYT